MEVRQLLRHVLHSWLDVVGAVKESLLGLLSLKACMSDKDGRLPHKLQRRGCGFTLYWTLQE